MNFSNTTLEGPSSGGGGAGVYLPLTGGILTGPLIQSTNGAASTPPLLLSGTWFTGGTATTTKPQLLIEPAGTTSTAWSTSGTGLGVNAPAGFAGNLLDLQVGSVSAMAVGAGGMLLNFGFGQILVSSNGNTEFVVNQGIRTTGNYFCVNPGAGGTTGFFTLPTATQLSVTSNLSTPIDVLLRAVIANPLTVATLPAGIQGMIACVTDATQSMITGIGQTAVGSGTNVVPVFYDGTSWKII